VDHPDTSKGRTRLTKPGLRDLDNIHADDSRTEESVLVSFSDPMHMKRGDCHGPGRPAPIDIFHRPSPRPRPHTTGFRSHGSRHSLARLSNISVYSISQQISWQLPSVATSAAALVPRRVVDHQHFQRRHTEFSGQSRMLNSRNDCRFERLTRSRSNVRCRRWSEH
jgi:hypothetical protein